MMRIALGITYNGSAYCGWQKQDFVPTVQATVEFALSCIAGHEVTVYCAGRTDAGVHAVGQVVHFDTTANRKLSAWVQGSNSCLPNDVAVSWAQIVDDDFHARFSAYSRRYCYIIANQQVKSALFPDRLTWYPYNLNIAAMQESCQYFLGEQDFTSLRSASCSSKSPMRNIVELSIKIQESLILITVEANAFLHHMVRNLVGVLLYIGSNKAPPHWAKEVLQAKNRCYPFVTAPPCGLYLQRVSYPLRYQLPNADREYLLVVPFR